MAYLLRLQQKRVCGASRITPQAHGFEPKSISTTLYKTLSHQFEFIDSVQFFENFRLTIDSLLNNEFI
jgi:hypothetical protein